MDPAKLKVVELRSELSQRGLDTKGVKAVLVERLRKALEDESNDVKKSVPSDSCTKNSSEESVDNDEKREKSPEVTKVITSPVKTPGRSPKRSSSGSSPTKVTSTRSSPKTLAVVADKITQESPVKSPVIEKASPVIETPVPAPVTDATDDDDDQVDEADKSVTKIDSTGVELTSESSEMECTPQVAEEAPEIRPSIQDEPEAVTKTAIDAEACGKMEISNKSDELPDKSVALENDKEDECLEEKKECPEEKEISDENEDDGDGDDKTDLNENKKESVDNEMEVNDVDNYDNSSITKNEENAEDARSSDIKDSEMAKVDPEPEEEKIKTDERAEEAENEKTNDDVEIKKKEQDERDSKDHQDRRDRKDRKRKRSNSSQDDRHKSPSRMDDEPEIDYSRVLLSWYDSDLNLIIDKTKFLSATPMHNDGFGYVWAGARASFGFTNGKVYYEVKITHQCNVSLEDEENPHVLRAGWSAPLTSMQLGEEKLSYGYGETGKKCTDNDFKDYGPTFGLNDVVGCYLDMSDDDVVISYTLNNESLGEAFKFSKSELDGKALFPHILTKNYAFVCNFGDEEPWSTNILNGYTPVGKVDVNERIPGPRRPDGRQECEILMMVGLPSAGKTVWANKYSNDNLEKKYNILGVSNIIDRMKVMGLPRRDNHKGNWDQLMGKCTRCLNKLIEVAATRRRNYILDQTNVYPSAQRRKMRQFNGFQRKAIIIVPTDEEFKSRAAKRELVDGKDLPDSEFMEMKANFAAPSVGESFDIIEWIELDEEEAKKLISKYNKEGKDAGFGQPQSSSKRPRLEKSDSHRDSRDTRSSRDSRDSRDHRDRRSDSDRNRNSTWRGSMGSGGGSNWRDRGPRSGPPMRHSGSYGGSSRGWGGRGGPSSSQSHRGSDRRGSSSSDRRSGAVERSRSGSVRQGGGWGPMNSSYGSSHSSGAWSGSGHGGGGWSGQSQQQNNWGSGSWAGQQSSSWGNWKGYGGQPSQSSYNQSGYGNGSNWGSWNQQQQYYNQYWGQQQSQSQSVSTTGQTATTTGSSSTTASTASTGSTQNSSYPQGWQGYATSYYPTSGSTTNAQQQK
ncbi:heterogeneous nuclear ribonucleoprotein U-like protein 1 isoform X2 [Microplitis mediator]|uniref:heterogeneous nuclear ribonucleoprotein U-like protein 1 isoform X2 n=1 Tax=Microplitis mediator TaxID=375433 RepID=UPI00255328BB|nr:heterogeneous nuclear ribonucleoprotein U-like protein 1 isoform X2 [Microplitis mediator]